LGQQLLPVLTVGGAGTIDGLSAAFPKSVVKLFNLFEQKDQSAESLAAQRELQYKITKGEKLVVRWGTIGIREAVARVVGLGDADGGRLPLQGGFPEGDLEWKKWQGAIEALQAFEKSL
jgi:2-keto-3-deoxy-L-rhamnonate aldolase